MNGKKLRISLIAAVCMMCLTAPQTFAKNKTKSDRTFMINAGGGFGLIIPGFDIYTEEWSSNYNSFTYINFGGYLVGNFGMTFDMGKKKKWSLGPAIQIGYKAEGGPFTGYSEKRGSEIKTWLADELYDNNNIENKARFMHALIADVCLAVKGNAQKSARLVAEAGLRFSFAAMYDYTNYKVTVPDDYESGWTNPKWRFMLGPSVFIGGDAYASDHLMLTPGLRVAAAFGIHRDGVAGVSVKTSYDSFGNPVPAAEVSTYNYKYQHSYIDIAFELKINWYNKY